jgi:hypothetical protein
MPDDPLASALEQAERSDPPVRAAARMRIARVQSASDPDQARRTFQTALDEVRKLPSHEREFFLEQAQLFAAAIAPDLISEIHIRNQTHRPFQSQTLGRIMLEHGHQDAAFEYLIRYDESSTFPFSLVAELMHRIEDEDQRLAMLHRAIEAWRANSHEDPIWSRAFGFIWIFQWHWKTLPHEEALAITREIVRTTLERPDQPTSSGYNEDVHFTSGREDTLFKILHILRHLDAPLAESLIASHDQLAAAARRYPNGIESIHQETEERREAEERRRKASGESAFGKSCGGFIMAGNPRDFGYQMSLMQASKDGNFAPAIEAALERYREDTAPDGPNYAPKEFWPSTCSFRSILFHAGKLSGQGTAVYLNQIPDDDLRLFAQIELLTALAGLLEFQSVQRRSPNPLGRPPQQRNIQKNRRTMPDPMRSVVTGGPMHSPNGSLIRCPKCDWQPAADVRWHCKCGHRWNTFWTNGLCPACHYQWEITGCFQCYQVSPHSKWYVPEQPGESGGPVPL